MKYYPQVLTIHNSSEKTLWLKLQTALLQEEGIAFSRFPIFGAWGNRKSEPDILLILRNYGVIILESKGCHLRNINSINGQVWKMNDWYVPEIKPWEQLDRQVAAVKKYLGDSSFASFVHGRVVLPFISQSEWQNSGFLQDQQYPTVWNSDYLEVNNLLSILHKIKMRCPPPNLTDDQWASLKGTFERKNKALELKEEKSSPILLTYDGDKPGNKDIEQLLLNAGLPIDFNDKNKYTYLVATTKLEWERQKHFKPEHQVNKGDKSNTLRFSREKDANGELVHLLFRNALRHLVPERIMSRSEERTLLSRAFKKVAGANETQLLQLGHDLFVWRDALALLVSEGADLSGIPKPEIKEKFTVPSLADLAHQIYTAFEEEREKEGKDKAIFECAVRNYLKGDFRPTPYVIMEGFSFLTPLQRYFIQRCTEMGSQVVLIYPYRSEQDYAFQVMKHTYSKFNREPIRENTEFKSTEGAKDLLRVKSQLFIAKAPLYTFASDGSVTLHSFTHQHDEVAACINKIKSYLQEGRKAMDLLIVAQDPEAYTPLLLEEATLQGLPPNTFNIPPRQLLLTPLGNFILGLYQIWQNNTLLLKAEQFESFLASGLIGKAQTTTDRFRAIRDQWFATSESKTEWERRLSELEYALPAYKDSIHLPISGITSREVAIWRDTLAALEQLCRKLFDGAHVAIREHVKKLLEELKLSIDNQELLTTERTLLEQIQNALEELTEFDTLPVSTQEFGDLLSGMVQERKEVEETLQKNRINIVQPQGVDGSSQKIIFYLGLNNQTMPRPYTEPWPLYHDRQEAHYQQERYLFLAVARAASEKLHLSYARADGDHLYQPSIYFKEVANCLSAKIEKDKGILGLIDESKNESPVVVEKIYGRRDVYALTELLQYKLCPYRYKLGRLDKRAQQFNSKWALRYQAQGNWLRAILTKWCMNETDGVIGREIKSRLLFYKEETRSEIMALFPGFDNVDWISVQQGLIKTIVSLIGWYEENLPNSKLSFDMDNYSISIVRNDERLIIEEFSLFSLIRTFKRRILTDPLVNEEWLLPRSGEGYDVNNKVRIRDGVEVFAHDYPAFIEWSKMIKDLNSITADQRTFLNTIIKDIENNKFPKNEGDHCAYCPVQGTCLGINEEPPLLNK